MTAIRKSLLFGFEDEFGMGLGANQHWFAPPPGSFISHTHNRATNRVNATGSKKYDFIAYGKYSGTWDWSFYLDYDYLEPLKCMFEREIYIGNGSYSDIYKFTRAVKVSPKYHALDNTGVDCTDENFSWDSANPMELMIPDGNGGSMRADGTTIYRVVGHPLFRSGEYWYLARPIGAGGWRLITPGRELIDADLSYIFTISSLEGANAAEIDDSLPKTTMIQIQTRGATVGGEYASDDTWFMQFGYPFSRDELKMPHFDDTVEGLADDEAAFMINDKYTIIDGHVQMGDGLPGAYRLQNFTLCEPNVNDISLKKVNEGRIPSMVFRIVTLNRMAGGELDEILEVRGCVCKSMRFSNSAGNSQWGVSLSGFCTREVMWLGRLAHTDYRKHDGELTQFACLFTGAEANKDTYVANCDSIQISIENNAEVLDSTCTPYSPWYFEQITNYALTAVVYSFDPMLFKQRLYAGGQSLRDIFVKKVNDGDVQLLPGESIETRSGITTALDHVYHDDSGDSTPTIDRRSKLPPGTSEAITDDGRHVQYLTTPLCKKLAPAKDFLVVSYDACRNDMGISQESTDTLMDAINLSKNRIQFHFIDTVIKALSWQRGDGQKIMDSLSSAECWEIDVTIRTDRTTIENPNNYMTPIGPVYDNQKRIWIDPATNQEANTDKEWS